MQLQSPLCHWDGGDLSLGIAAVRSVLTLAFTCVPDSPQLMLVPLCSTAPPTPGFAFLGFSYLESTSV